MNWNTAEIYPAFIYFFRFLLLKVKLVVMPLRKLLRFRRLILVIFSVVCTLMTLQNILVKENVVKINTKKIPVGRVSTINFSVAKTNASIRTTPTTSKAKKLLKTKETDKSHSSPSVNFSQNYVIQFLQHNQVFVPKVYQQDFTALKKYVDYLKQAESAYPLQTKAVIILTNYRSGSSFFGELLNQHPDVFYVFEPLIPAADLWSCLGNEDIKKDIVQNLSQCIIPNWKQMQPEKIKKPIMGPHIALSCFKRKFCFAPKTKELLTDEVCSKSRLNRKHFDPWFHCGEVNLNLTANICRKKKMVAMKLIRACNISSFEEIVTKLNVDLKIIHLVRDPRGIGSSRMLLHGKSSLKTSKFTCDRLTYNAKFGLSPGQSWLKGRYKMFRYEDVALDPENKARELFEFLDLEFVASVRDWIVSNTASESSNTKPTNVSINDPKKVLNNLLFSDDPWDLKRDSKKVVRKWQQHLAFQQVKTIENHCNEFMRIAGYVPVSDEADYANKSKFFFLDKFS